MLRTSYNTLAKPAQRPPIPVANSFFTRLGGLLFTKAPAALLFPHCTSVHSMCMPYTLLIVHLSNQGDILACYPLRPYALSRRVSATAHILELSLDHPLASCAHDKHLIAKLVREALEYCA